MLIFCRTETWGGGERGTSQIFCLTAENLSKCLKKVCTIFYVFKIATRDLQSIFLFVKALFFLSTKLSKIPSNLKSGRMLTKKFNLPGYFSTFRDQNIRKSCSHKAKTNSTNLGRIQKKLPLFCFKIRP